MSFREKNVKIFNRRNYFYFSPARDIEYTDC